MTKYFALILALTCACLQAAEPPGARLGRPLRVHIARGLWWDMLHLHEAVGLLGGGDFSNSVDVYGSTNGYHGSAQAMGTFPHHPDQLAGQDIIILAGSRVAALPAATQTALVAWVKRGGGLLITGGPLSLGCDRYGALAEILPVTYRTWLRQWGVYRRDHPRCRDQGFFRQDRPTTHGPQSSAAESDRAPRAPEF